MKRLTPLSELPTPYLSSEKLALQGLSRWMGQKIMVRAGQPCVLLRCPGADEGPEKYLVKELWAAAQGMRFLRECPTTF